VLASNIGAGAPSARLDLGINGISAWWWAGRSDRFDLALFVGPRLWRIAAARISTAGDYLERYG
jgi:hypothetical protein